MTTLHIIKKEWENLGFKPNKTDENGFIDIKYLPVDFDIGNLNAKHISKKGNNRRITLVRPKSLIGIELYKKYEKKWINVQDYLPPFDKRVIFRAVTTWRKENSITYFDDEITRDEETLDYGQTAYILKNQTDYLVCMHPSVNEILDQYITHWMEIPEI